MPNSARSCSKANKTRLLYLFGAAFVLISLILGITLGSTSISLFEIFNALTGNASPSANVILLVRLPRTLAAVVCGAALSVSGAVIQGVLANRLASPSIIGVTSGAGLAVTVCTALGIYSGWGISLFSFAGAFLSVMLVSLASKKWNASKGTVILIGVALNSLLGALSDTVITFFPEAAAMSRDFRMGDFSAITYDRLIPAAVLISIAFVITLTLSNDLNVLSLGEETAAGLGMNTSVSRTIFLLLAALTSGCAVSLAGLISFVGLIVPHTVRRLSGSQSPHLLALSALFGGGFVSLCDTVARVVFSPYEIPVGIIMGFIGAPFFVFILIKRKGGHSRD